jgi:hypothetical protein
MDENATKYTPKFGHFKPKMTGIEYKGDRMDGLNQSYQEHLENVNNKTNYIKILFFRFKFFMSNGRRFNIKNFDEYDNNLKESKEFVVKR